MNVLLTKILLDYSCFLFLLLLQAHNIKLDKKMIKPFKPLRKRGRPRTRPYNSDGVDASSSKESKRTSRPPKKIDVDYHFGLKKKPRRETISDKVFRY